jgi:hypothetical protein
MGKGPSMDQRPEPSTQSVARKRDVVGTMTGRAWDVVVEDDVPVDIVGQCAKIRGTQSRSVVREEPLCLCTWMSTTRSTV